MAASLSWVSLERPLNRLKDHFPYVPQPRGNEAAREPAETEQAGTGQVSARS